MIKIYEKIEISDILNREPQESELDRAVCEIIKKVRETGDKGLIEFTEKFDKVRLDALEVTEFEIEEALRKTDAEFIEILREACENIRLFHNYQKRSGFSFNKDDGVLLGQKITPLARVGIYVPGGTARYPSTVLMNTIPAKIAGVSEIIMVTPPRADGSVDSAILSAARLAGVDRIFKVGGAQAIAALAYGTETIPAVDKIVGPGNVYVAKAKRQVYGTVAIDMIAGPSEILIIADNTCNAEYVAADMLSQAEHDRLASAVLITTDIRFAKEVNCQLEKQIPQLRRKEIARKSIDDFGKIIVVNSIQEAFCMSNALAPEHLEICLDNAEQYLDSVTNAGSIFLGKYTPESLGDYFAGPNHTLPTSGTARFSSPLSVDDFIKKSSYIQYTQKALIKSGAKVTNFAEREGLDGHARAVTIRMDDLR